MMKNQQSKYFLIVALFLLFHPMAMAAEICKDLTGNVVEITAGTLCATATNGYGDVAPLCLKSGSCPVSGDGSISISDAVVILRLALGLVDPTTVIWPAAGGIPNGTTNTLPVAKAGANQNAIAGATVTLDGSASLNAGPSAPPIAFFWTQTSGTPVTLSSLTTAKPTFTAPTQAATLVFSLTVSDGKASSTPSTTTVTVTAAPTVLTALDSTLTLDEDTAAATGTLKASSPGTGLLNYTIVKAPTFGKVVITNVVSGAYRYTPNKDAHGQDSFTFKTNEGTTVSNEAKITITVNPVNDPPVIGTIPNQFVNKGFATELMPLSISDIDSTTFKLSASSDNSALVPEANILFDTTPTRQKIHVTPVDGQTGEANITVTVSDGQLSAST